VALNEANPTKYPTILVYDDAGQKMEYAVGNAQSIGINTNAKDAFMTDVGRDIDELADIINNVKSAERKVEEIKGKLNDAPNNETLKYLKAAADKELNFFSNQMKEFIAGGITRSGEYFDQVNLASTQAGTVANRITIISDRLSANKETITEQASENENVNISDIAVEMQNVQMVYNASLIVTGKISRQSLLDYI
jgi:flagellar hook-associated protein 3 FlgL